MRVAFYCWVHVGDVELATQAIAQLRQFHPDNEVLMFSDGSLDPSCMDLFAGLGVAHHNLGDPKWLQCDRFLYTRYEALLAASQAEAFIKFDPDSQFHKPVEPLEADWYGQIFDDGGRMGTWGCGMGLSRAAIAKLLSIPIEQTSFTYTAQPSGEVLKAEDSTLSYYLNTIAGLTPTPWPAVSLKRVFSPIFLTRKWSITHPSLGKQIVPHRYHRIEVDRDAPLEAIEATTMQLGQDGFRGRAYLTPGHHEAYDAFRRNTMARIETGETMHPRQRYEAIRLAADGQIWHGDTAIANPINTSISWAWFAPQGISAREKSIRLAFDDDPKNPRYQ